jgi:3-methyladenine DNA glycosylase AlkC
MRVLKDNYNSGYARWLSQKIKTAYPAFDEAEFVKYIRKNIRQKEFLQRMDVFVEAFKKFLTQNYEDDLEIFQKIWGPELKTETGMFSIGGWLWPVGRYVELLCPKNIPLSLNFIKELTKRFTGEFAVRPLLREKPKLVLKTIVKWSRDKNVHVRRLSSECLRISLPWAKKLYLACSEFETYKKILSHLKNDPSKFVQKSVGNNLNDLYKESPPKAQEIIAEWKRDNPSQETLWIINHGLRSLRKKDKTHKKKGSRGALQ